MTLQGYQKRYRLRRAVPGAKSLEVTFPFEVADRAARELGLSLDDFLCIYSVIAEYDNGIVRYSLVLTPKE